MGNPSPVSLDGYDPSNGQVLKVLRPDRTAPIWRSHLSSGFLSPTCSMGPTSSQQPSISGPGPFAMEFMLLILKMLMWLVATSHVAQSRLRSRLPGSGGSTPGVERKGGRESLLTFKWGAPHFHSSDASWNIKPLLELRSCNLHKHL